MRLILSIMTFYFETLSTQFRITGTALAWFESYLKDHSESVCLNGAYSKIHTPTCSVPEGLVLGPLLFSMNMKPDGAIIRKHTVDYDSFADNGDLYFVFKLTMPNSIEAEKFKLEECARDVKKWLLNHMLMMNDDKTEFLIISSTYWENPKYPRLVIGDNCTSNISHVCNVGIIFDHFFTTGNEVSNKI